MRVAVLTTLLSIGVAAALLPTDAQAQRFNPDQLCAIQRALINERPVIAGLWEALFCPASDPAMPLPQCARTSSSRSETGTFPSRSGRAAIRRAPDDDDLAVDADRQILAAVVANLLQKTQSSTRSPARPCR